MIFDIQAAWGEVDFVICDMFLTFIRHNLYRILIWYSLYISSSIWDSHLIKFYHQGENVWPLHCLWQGLHGVCGPKAWPLPKVTNHLHLESKHSFVELNPLWIQFEYLTITISKEICLFCRYLALIRPFVGQVRLPDLYHPHCSRLNDHHHKNMIIITVFMAMMIMILMANMVIMILMAKMMILIRFGRYNDTKMMILTRFGRWSLHRFFFSLSLSSLSPSWKKRFVLFSLSLVFYYLLAIAQCPGHSIPTLGD